MVLLAKRRIMRAVFSKEHVCESVLFVTSLCRSDAPRNRFSALKLIRDAGYEVIVPPAQTCCGQPAYNSGDRALARDLAEKTLREFEQFDYVVAPSGSCGGMIRAHYGDLFRDDPELMGRYTRFQQKVYELTDFLANVAKVSLAPGEFTGPSLSRFVLGPARTRREGTIARARAARHRGHRNEGLRALLRLRRHVRGQVRRHFGGHCGREARTCARPARAPSCSAISAAC